MTLTRIEEEGQETAVHNFLPDKTDGLKDVEPVEQILNAL